MKFTRIFLTLLLLLAPAKQALAVVSLSVKNENVSKAKILFFGFDQGDAEEILVHIRKNLNSTDLFEIVRQKDGLKIRLAGQNSEAPSEEEISVDKITADSIPDFEKYRKLNIDAIVIGQFSRDPDGNLELRIRMWDVLDQRQFFGKLYTASQSNYRKMANVISNEIFKAITGEKSGHFNSQITYIAESGTITHRIKKIKIIDFDGGASRTLVEGEGLILTPVFSSNRDEVFYLRYFRGKPQIFGLNLKSFRGKKLGGFKGTTFAAHSNPSNPNLVVLSAIIDGNSDIYEMNISANIATRLTKNPAIDTTPTYSPDGRQIAFSSDRDSGQQIYIMDSNGTSVKRITSGKGSYAKPVWSPDGKTLAFTRIKGGQFFIGTIGISGKGEKLLTTGYVVEGARWSPNGRYLVYSKKKGAYGRDSVPRLYTIDIVTGFERELPTPESEGATDPDWR